MKEKRIVNDICLSRFLGLKIKTKDKSKFICDLHKLVLKNTNAGLVSIAIDCQCKKFIKELEKEYLSEEFQYKKCSKSRS